MGQDTRGDSDEFDSGAAGGDDGDELDTFLRAVAAAPAIDFMREEADLSGTKIGVFVLGDVLGSGGMGVVYRATDQELGREIAIKLQRPTQDPNYAARTYREASAMAQVSHPNVVSIFDVGMWNERVYIAMELVEGQTLAQWSKASHSWSDVVAVMTQAAAGLSAAHAVGIIHRDFKPDNVLIGADGRPRVADFGLARSRDSDSDRAGPSVKGSNALSSDSLTRTGAVMGTLAYMSPEQLDGERVDVRSDQFSFCVALFEALYGTRPFVGRTPTHLLRQIRTRDIVSTPPKAHIPGWLRAIILRGLSCNAGDRYPDMDALLAALMRVDQGRRWRLRVAGGATIATLGAAGVLLMPAPSPPCAGTTLRPEQAWSPAKRAALAAVFDRTQAPNASATFDKVRAGIDSYLTGWEDAHRQLCDAERDQPAKDPDPGFDCLEARLQEVSATVASLNKTDRKTLARAPTMLDHLKPATECLGEQTAGRGSTQAALSPAARAVHLDTLSIKMLRFGGHTAEALAIAEATDLGALQRDDTPIVAKFLLQRGRIQLDARDIQGARPDLERAFELAEVLHLDQVAAGAAIRMGQLESDIQASRRWARQALAIGKRGPGCEVEMAIAYDLLCRAMVKSSADVGECHELLKRGIALADGAGLAGEDAAHTLRSHIGLVHKVQGNFDAALTIAQETVDSDRARFGSSSLSLAVSLNNLGNAQEAVDRSAESETSCLEAVRICQEFGDIGNAYLARAWECVAVARNAAHDSAGAIEALQALLSALEHSADQPRAQVERPRAHHRIAEAAVKLGDYDLAEVSVAKASVGRANDPSQDWEAYAALLSAEIANGRGNHEKGLKLRRKALALFVEYQPQLPIRQAEAHCDLADSFLRLGRPEAAKSALDDAVSAINRIANPSVEKNRLLLEDIAGKRKAADAMASGMPTTPQPVTG